MNKRWDLIEEIFDKALKLSRAERERFVDAQGVDESIRRELMSLLDHADRSGSFLEPGDDSAIGIALGKAAHSLDLLQGVREVGEKTTHALSDADSGDFQIKSTEDLLRTELRRCYPQYQLDSLIGRGGQAAVFSATDTRLGRRVAIRVPLAGNLSKQKIRTDVIRDGRALSRIQNPHVVTIYEVHVDGEVCFSISELADGPTLRQLLLGHGILPPRVAADLVRQAALGILAIHEQSLVHGDVKPANLLLQNKPGIESGYLVKVTDFGLSIDNESGQPSIISRLEADEGDSAGMPITGTLSYVSPERIEGRSKGDPASDIYALGVTLYQTLTGILPYRGSRLSVIWQIGKGDPLRPRAMDDRIPVDLENICLKAMNVDPANRYASAALLAEDLGRFLAGEPTMARPATMWQGFCRRAVSNWKQWTVFAAIGASVLLATVFLTLAWNSSRLQQAQIDSFRTSLSESRIATLLLADHSMLQNALSNVERFTADERQQFRKVADDDLSEPYQRMNAAIVQLHMGEDRWDLITALLPSIPPSPELFQVLVSAPGDHSTASRKLDEVGAGQVDQAYGVQLAMLAWGLKDSARFSAICNELEQPDMRSQAILMFPSWRPAFELLSRRLSTEEEPLVQYTLISGIGRIDARSMRQHQFHLLEQALSRLATQRQNAGLKQISSWAMNRLGMKQPSRVPEPFDPADQWRETETGLTLVRIPPGTATLGVMDPEVDGERAPPHEVTISAPFWIADNEISVATYRQFLEDETWDRKLKPDNSQSWSPDPETSPSPDHPATRVSWLDAVLFCNWLSEQEGLQPSYFFEGIDDLADVEPLRLALATKVRWEASGYRLPTEAEYEYSSRCGCLTRHWFGDNTTWLPEFVVASATFRIPAAKKGTTIPNPFGVHDLEGSVWEWCFDWHGDFGPQPSVDPRGPDAPPPGWQRKTHRGGGVATSSGTATVVSRGNADPGVRWSNLGFRVVRNVSEQ